MPDLELWHNPRCSKSRAAKALIEDSGSTCQVVAYLETPPDRDRLVQVMAALGLSDPRAMMRTGEAHYRDLGLADATADQLLDAMAANPVLIERPILIRGERAVIGRPPERVLDLLDGG